MTTKVLVLIVGLVACACVGATTSDDSTGSTLSDGLLQLTVERVNEGELPPPGVEVVDGRVRAQVVVDGSTSPAREAIVACGGEVLGESASEGVLDAMVPLDCLISLERLQSVEALRPLYYVDPAK